MAAPPEITCTNLSGKFIMSKSLSDDVDAMLTLQGLSWFTRKAISLATVVLTVKEYKEDSFYHIDITSVASGLSTTQENRTLDWQLRDHADRIFGKVQGRSRLWQTGSLVIEGPASEEDAAFLRAEKLKDGQTDSKFLDDEHVQSWVKNVDGGDWIAEQTWGFEEIKGERRYTRRVVVWKGGKVQRARLVYDYQGKAEAADDDDDVDEALAYE
ncbi:hypothetical protein A1O3_07844 [Capronia epimyces CBS 606.96]|uniref:Uncharacterized protein n=1 Tax=Capronia epimyces CBS 606.96 TaxID=1182542 RepID=W9XQG4_9EURO|nr:uncharacterized protein A1O3_07844 [Capronia epimyces CBS 606.96]EXJ79565.1 hypothetical protein A1O3_07844 [Capronia epimyces CBS 606.96]